jgi:predicted nucleotidyltransferase
MRRDEALRIVADHREQVAKFGVDSLAIFGSVARDEAGPNSDVDVLVEFREPVGYFRLFDLEEFLTEIFHRPVDLFTPGSLPPRVQAEVLREAVRAA